MAIPCPCAASPSARGGWRAPRHLPAAFDRPIQRPLRRGDGATRPARGVGARRSPRDRRAPPAAACASRPRPVTSPLAGWCSRWGPPTSRCGRRGPRRSAAVEPRSATCSSPGFGSKRRSRSLGRWCSGAGSPRSSSRCGWPAPPWGGHPARAPSAAGPRVRCRLALDGPARWREFARSTGAEPGGHRARAAHGVGTRRDRAPSGARRLRGAVRRLRDEVAGAAGDRRRRRAGPGLGRPGAW